MSQVEGVSTHTQARGELPSHQYQDGRQSIINGDFVSVRPNSFLFRNRVKGQGLGCHYSHELIVMFFKYSTVNNQKSTWADRVFKFLKFRFH